MKLSPPTEIDRPDLSSGLPERLSCLLDVRRRLNAATGVDDLLALTTQIACKELDFTRAVVLSVEPGRLSAQASGALSDPASDRLRRRILASPIRLRAGSAEAEIIRRGTSGQHSQCRSQVAETFGLTHHLIAPISPEHRTLALLVVDRREREVDDVDRALLTLLAEFLAAALERTVTRSRQEELASEFRHLTTSALALMHEVVDSPTSLPRRGSPWPAFPLTDQLNDHQAAESRLAELLTASEAQVASLLVKGRSNREIADEVFFSPETVKATVARILRKLGAANRVEAAAIILRLSG